MKRTLILPLLPLSLALILLPRPAFCGPAAAQVQIESRIAEVSASDPYSLGLSFSSVGPGSSLFSALPALRLNSSIIDAEVNFCEKEAPAAPKDHYFNRKGSWGQSYDDQWGIKRIGFTSDSKSAWRIEDGTKRPVIVAVIDTGLDWNHKDIDWKNIWNNPKEIAGNGIDDDGNGYVDDLIGWNFVANNNKPWDDDGHGTFVAGIIAAAHNDIGISGINPGAKIMVVKALNAFGHTRASNIAQAIIYAVDNGAQIINISVGGKHLSRAKQDALDYAHSRGVLVVMAAGNEATDTADYSSGLNHLITVAATDPEDRRVNYSNWGQQVDIAAPGTDVLSLRARQTDFLSNITDSNYHIGDAYVGKDKRYFRAGGTSFAAPMVSATASLILANKPKLSHIQVRHMLLNSARDIETPGWDQLTGYGLLDARAALKADPDYYTITRIGKIEPAQVDDRIVIQVQGSSLSSDYKDAWMELGFGENPKEWTKVSDSIPNNVQQGVLASIDAKHITKPGKWTIRLIVKTKKNGSKETRGSLDIE